ncbi:MAG: ATP-binding protein [Romboutsia sp.]|uniref:PAS domain-containing sensor histidine kinase n=1 Tax=Romboutsia sp. TaxID=1965302 RepID=UPI003F2D3E86
MKQFLDNMDIYILIVNKELNPLLCNKKLLKKLNCNEDELCNLKINIKGISNFKIIDRTTKKENTKKQNIRLSINDKIIELETTIIEENFCNQKAFCMYSSNVKVINYTETVENINMKENIKKEIEIGQKSIYTLNYLLNKIEKEELHKTTFKDLDIINDIELVLGEIYKADSLRKDFELFLGISADLVGTIKISGKINTTSEGWTECLGWSEKELYEFNIIDLIHDDYKNELINILESSDEDVKTIENRVRCKDNSYKWLRWNIKLVKEQQGLVFTIRDISEDVADKERKKQLEEAIHLESIKNEFFANMSHEFKTPLNIILGTVQLLDRNANDKNITWNEDLDLNKYIKLIKQNSYRLLRLVNNIIDMTRIDNGYYELRLGNHDIVRVIEDITLSVANYIEGQGINLIFDTNCEEKVIACDPEKIERILLNLLSNSIKYTKEDGFIYVTLDVDKKNINISVKDNGEGIPEDKLPVIFNRFVQGDNNTLTRPCEGSGIGLSLVKSLVEMHEGNIGVKSKKGLGTDFQFYLPNKKVVYKEDENVMNFISENNKIEMCHIEFSDIYGI